jgi:hypothetical protein
LNSFRFFFYYKSYLFFWRLWFILLCVNIFTSYFFFHIIFYFHQYLFIYKKFFILLISIKNFEIIELIQNFGKHSYPTVLYFIGIHKFSEFTYLIHIIFLLIFNVLINLIFSIIIRNRMKHIGIELFDFIHLAFSTF